MLSVDMFTDRLESFKGIGRFGVGSHDYAVGLKVGDAVVGTVAREDGLAKHGEVAAGVFGEVAGDGVVVVDDQGVGGLALGAVDGVLEPAVEGRRRKWGDRVGPGADCGNDHKSSG